MATDILSPTLSADPIGEINKYDFHTESKPVFRARKGLEKVYRRIDAFLTGQLGDPALSDAFEKSSPLSGAGRRRLPRPAQMLLPSLGCKRR